MTTEQRPSIPPDDQNRLEIFESFLGKINEPSASFAPEPEEQDEDEIPMWSGVEISEALSKALDNNTLTPELAEELYTSAIHEERLDLLTAEEIEEFQRMVRADIKSILENTDKGRLTDGPQTALLLDTLNRILDALLDWSRQKPERDEEFVFVQPALWKTFRKLEEEVKNLIHFYPNQAEFYESAIDDLKSAIEGLSKFKEVARWEVTDIQREMLDIHVVSETLESGELEVVVDEDLLRGIIEDIRDLYDLPGDDEDVDFA